MVKVSDLKKDIYKPGDIAKMLGLTTRTIQVYCNKGFLICGTSATGRRYIEKDNLISFLREKDLLIDDIDNNKYDIVYARVSTNKQKDRGDLDRQKDKIILSSIDKNLTNIKIITEVGSGLNDNRKGLSQMLDMVMDNKVNRIFILYKDRLTRFGFNYIKQVCDKHNVEIVIVSDDIKDKSVEEELAEDIISIIHSFSGDLYDTRNQVLNKVRSELE